MACVDADDAGAGDGDGLRCQEVSRVYIIWVDAIWTPPCPANHVVCTSSFHAAPEPLGQDPCGRADVLLVAAGGAFTAADDIRPAWCLALQPPWKRPMATAVRAAEKRGRCGWHEGPYSMEASNWPVQVSTLPAAAPALSLGRSYVPDWESRVPSVDWPQHAVARHGMARECREALYLGAICISCVGLSVLQAEHPG